MAKLEGSQRLLVLLTGPVGAGKSSTAAAIAAGIREQDRSAAVVDLDLVYQMARQSDGYASEATWRAARRAAAAIAGEFFDAGIDVVIIEGGFHSAEECDEARSGLPANVASALVTLKVSYEETARRIAADPAEDRVFSRDPKVLSYLYRHFESALGFLMSSSVVIDADGLSLTETARAVLEKVAP